MPHRIVTEERELLEDVRTLLQENPYVLPPSEKSLVEELVRIREELPSAKDEDKAALLQQYDQSIAQLERLREVADMPQVDPDSPYFAHLRLDEDGRPRDIFLGKATRLDGGIRIVDWRNAPISKIFYRYQQGDVFEEPMGGRTMRGEVVVRRTTTIRAGSLMRVDGPEGTFVADGDAEDGWRHSRKEPPRLAGGEGAAMRAYGKGEGSSRRLGTDLHGSRRRADKRLPDIASLIDEDQFDLITRPSSGFVVIRGTAGSGKTTVALHRIAYLAYSDPQINSNQTLFVVFSPGLRDYVGHVLPALGVGRVQVQDFRSWATKQRQRHFPRLPKQTRDNAPAVVTALKLHPAMMLALSRQVDRVHAKGTSEQVLDDWMSTLVDFDLLREALDDIEPDGINDSELRRAVVWNRDRAQELVAWREGDKEVDAGLETEDEALLLYAWQLRVGPLRGKGKRPLRYRHVAVDEVQDFSPLEIRILINTLDRKQSITLAGDTQQHVMKDAGFTSWADFFSHLGLEGTEVDTLRIAYRSSREVVEFSMGVLGDLREDDTPPLVTRSGPPVELFRFTDHGAAVAFLADALRELQRDEPLASIALLTPNRGTSATYFRGLEHSDVPRLRRVMNQDFVFAPGVEITEVDQVKGLEFDYVVLVEASAHAYPDTPAARRLLHVGCTRAVHQLWLTSVAEPSSVLPLSGR